MRRRLLLAFVVLSACSFNWMIGSGDAGGPDASHDAAIDAPTEARADAPADVIDTGIMDAGPPDCAALASDLAQAREKALECKQQANQCMTSFADECGCKFNVQQAGMLVAALNAYEEAGCHPASCPMPCPMPMNLCLFSDASSTMYACQ